MQFSYWLISIFGAIFAVPQPESKCTQGTLKRFKNRLGLNSLPLPDSKPYCEDLGIKLGYPPLVSYLTSVIQYNIFKAKQLKTVICITYCQ